MISTGVYVGNLETLYCKEEIKKANNGYYNFNVRLDEKLRTEAAQILANYGLSPIQAIIGYIFLVYNTLNYYLLLSIIISVIIDL